MTVKAKPSLRYTLILDNSARLYPDGREVCVDTHKGIAEYKRRLAAMVERQKGICGINPTHRLHIPTFEHSAGRGSGGSRRDDRIVDENGQPMNCAACLWCNSAKGSRRSS